MARSYAKFIKRIVFYRYIMAYHNFENEHLNFNWLHLKASNSTPACNLGDVTI